MSDIVKFTETLFEDISNIINTARYNVKKSINYELAAIHWNIGRLIKDDIMQNGRAQYGAQIVDELSQRLSEAYGRGFGRRNLFNMIKFYEIFNDFQIVQSLIAQLSATHLKELMKIDDDLKRDFYIAMCKNENWSVKTLKDRISSMLYERTAISRLPEQTIINDLSLLKNENKMTTELFFRDPYVLDFLGLKDTYSEKDLESAILHELEKFVLEMGVDFAFLARQKRITIDNNDYYIDLLFYHRKMRRLVVIELKLGEFKAEYKGQVELYLRWLEKYEKIDGEESPIGIILCADKSEEIVELLELSGSGIHIAQYLTQLPPKEIFEQRLREAVIRARLMLEQNGKNTVNHL
jgi:predicted nuclease of restriction endonuclease-like (RecB) superfamily